MIVHLPLARYVRLSIICIRNGMLACLNTLNRDIITLIWWVAKWDHRICSRFQLRENHINPFLVVVLIGNVLYLPPAVNVMPIPNETLPRF